MHTIMIIIAGMVLFAIILLLARSVPALKPHYFPVFVLLWFLGSAINMWVGISHAGYSFMDELPIFFVVFLVPVATGWFIHRRAA